MRRSHWRRTGRRGALLLTLAVALVLPASSQAATADLELTKSDNPDPVVEGAVLTYEITVNNLGPGTASGVTVTDELSSQVDFVSAAASQGSCDRNGRMVTCDLGTVAGDPTPGSATVTIQVRPKKAGPLTNSASVAVGEGDNDPVAANNTEAETTTVTEAGGGTGGATCDGRAVTIDGTGAAETITGTDRVDVIKARGGNDVIRALQGKDTVCAGGGDDVVRGGGGNDPLKGGSGRDLVKGGGGNDLLRGGPGRDRCRGGAGRDVKRSC
jgi:uncharacterized repeat protein (TIGR01451 family)